MTNILQMTTPETEEEIQAVNDLLEKMRKEKAHKEKVQFYKKSIRYEIARAMGELGIEETKKIVRLLSAELREF